MGTQKCRGQLGVSLWPGDNKQAHRLVEQPAVSVQFGGMADSSLSRVEGGVGTGRVDNI